MSWEEPPQRRGRMSWLLPAGIGIAVLVVLIVAFAPRARSPSTLTVGPSAPPADADAADAVDPRDFIPDRIGRLRTATESAGDGPLLGGADLTIVAADDTGVQFVETVTGDHRRVQVVNTAPASLTDRVFVVGDSVIIDADADVVRIRDGGLRPVRIARNHRAITTIDDRSVWVFDNFSPFVDGIASRVDFDGEVHDQIRLPAVTQPLVGTDAGLVVTAPGAVSVISTDGSRQLIAPGTAVAADGERVAWLQCGDESSCAVVMGTMDDPDQVRTTLDPTVLPAGFFGIPFATFSPDGRWLALPVYRTRGRRGVEQSTVTVLDTATGIEVFRTDGSSVTPLDQPLAWSPDGRYLIFVSGSDIHAWRAGADESMALDTPLRGVRALAVR